MKRIVATTAVATLAGVLLSTPAEAQTAPRPGTAHHWLNAMPTISAGLASGESLNTVLPSVGMPVITATAIPGGGFDSDTGSSCANNSCGYEFSPFTSYELGMLVYGHGLTMQGQICTQLSSVTEGVSCFETDSAWWLLTVNPTQPAFVANECLYMGFFATQWRTVWQSC